nr:hypothetical protein [Tanacetum cinerariifolium]
MSSLKAKQPKKPPPKRTRNVGKSKRTQLSTSSLTESPPSDNGDFPSTKLSLRTEGVVGLRRWIEKIEQVFEISKCTEGDKVMFAASTFEGRALTWWNGNVHTMPKS